MSDAGITIANPPGPLLRNMREDELANIPPCIPRSCILNWLYGNAPQQPSNRQPVGWIVENSGRIAGFEICDVVVSRAAPARPRFLGPLARLVPASLRRVNRTPLRVELLEIVTPVPRPRADRIEQLLLRQLLRELSGSWSGVPIVVPESNLAAQLFLREGGFRAIRTIRDYYGGEDGYLMTRPGASPYGSLVAEEMGRYQFDPGRDTSAPKTDG